MTTPDPLAAAEPKDPSTFSERWLGAERMQQDYALVDHTRGVTPSPLTTAATAHREALEAQRLQQEAVKRRDAAVRAAHKAGHSAPEIAAALGVNRQRVYLILGKKEA